jgi:hypothetical protein
VILYFVFGSIAIYASFRPLDSIKYTRWVVLRGFLHVGWLSTLAHSSFPFLHPSEEGIRQIFLQKVRIGEGSEGMKFERCQASHRFAILPSTMIILYA